MNTFVNFVGTEDNFKFTENDEWRENYIQIKV